MYSLLMSLRAIPEIKNIRLSLLTPLLTEFLIFFLTEVNPPLLAICVSGLQNNVNGYASS